VSATINAIRTAVSVTDRTKTKVSES
jgi:hypothetical protein